MSRIFAWCVASCALLLLLPLAGCGGGSSGPTSPAATPTPVPIDRSCTAATYQPNFINNADPKFELARWRVFPLNVYFVPGAQNTPANRTLATQGFDKWGAATNNGATYRVVTQQSQANITVQFYNYQGGAGDVLGQTVPSFYDQSNTLSFAAVTLGITGDARNDGITATHEFGHALGIEGHSLDANDLMFSEGNDTRSGALTPADVNTLLTAYCGNFNKNATARLAPHRGQLKTLTIR